ncbi:CASP-like protein PIMP1 [Salvia miltiorrhiza]|uniref:CASP-like protein PIMP1 n=1 Tax=Salvia miltiorrhiza TaxID=226208 RepID=UPI0025AD5B8D|nr:CASP-like protein PIMP1 [Salvia miltiorrhiza]
MAPPPSYAVSPLVSLIVRILTFICLLISLILLATATGTASTTYGDVEVRFKDFISYRYLCAAVVMGLVYTAVQMGFTVYQMTTGNRFGGDGLVYIDFYGDKAASYILATGGAASIGMAVDLKDLGEVLGIGNFMSVANAAASLCLLAFLCSAVSSVFSSLALPKRV